MPACAVFKCNRRSQTSSLLKDGISFHLFPKDNRYGKWVQACHNHVTWRPKRTSTICSKHFEESCFVRLANNRRVLSPTAIPTLHLLMEGSYKSEASNSEKSYIEIHQDSNTETQYSPENSFSTQMEITLNAIPNLMREKRLRINLQQRIKQVKCLHSQISYLKKKVANLEEKLNSLTDGQPTKKKRKKGNKEKDKGAKSSSTAVESNNKDGNMMNALWIEVIDAV